VVLEDPAKRIRRFAEIRNKIVHQFTYMGEEDFREHGWPVMSGVQQHFFVAAFVDEVILRLFGLADHAR
jgi:hypothetical protein